MSRASRGVIVKTKCNAFGCRRGSTSEAGPPSPKTARAAVPDAITSLAASTAFFFIRANQHITLLLATLLTKTLGKHGQDVLLQFARSRFG